MQDIVKYYLQIHLYWRFYNQKVKNTLKRDNNKNVKTYLPVKLHGYTYTETVIGLSYWIKARFRVKCN